jgi:hypothetical protein
MGWVYFILLVIWGIWTICTHIGKIVTFLALTVCGIVAACFGLLAFEWVIIGLPILITFIQNHGWWALLSIGGIVAAVFMMFSVRNIPVVYYPTSGQHDDQ